MQGTKDYIKEIQRFVTSHYWSSGVRITAGVIIPMLIMLHQGWLSEGIAFLFGALFVSITDTPGPIHHRINGMIAAVTLNTIMVLITALAFDYKPLLLAEVVAGSFLLSFMGIYGARAGAIGTLGLVIMLINMSPVRQNQSAIISVLLTAGGGIWYAAFSLLLYRLQPYRIVEQALGENLIQTAAYIRARAAFYKEGADVANTFNRVMQEQVEVLKSQNQIRELLFKTRQLVGDASPRSRSLMMIFLESLDLFEETMYSYQDYKELQLHVDRNLVNGVYKIILQVVAEFEHIGLMVQSGIAIRKMPMFESSLSTLERAITENLARTSKPEEIHHLHALNQTVQNIRSINSRLEKIVLYTRMEAHDPQRFPDHDLERPTGSQQLTWNLFRENFTFRSNNFRYSIRLTLALVAGYVISALFTLSHAYWVMLTILTILKPVYNLTQRRNVQRVAGTLAGVLIASAVLIAISNNTVLVIIMILCMLFAYSLLRVHYLGFVTFLTIYIIITFHFLNPVEFRNLIGERLIDTLIGSVIAGIAARFFFPAWQQYQMIPAMKKVLIANTAYLLSAWNMRNNASHRRQYSAARNEAIVALTNLSDYFQQMLTEPGSSDLHAQAHQFVIANHMLCSRISTLTARDFVDEEQVRIWINAAVDHLEVASLNLESPEYRTPKEAPPAGLSPIHPISVIFSLARDLRFITSNGVKAK